ncbi:MAG TPA: hypothetical protein VL068_14500, partial [Microthrixaceae bacterium]|nr:hypothetical protein [Microthrixaceae bacterium]
RKRVRVAGQPKPFLTRAATWVTRTIAVVALVVAALGMGATVAGAAGHLNVSRVAGLEPGGALITVSGSGFDPAKGIYVALCVIPAAPGIAPGPCGGGIALEGSDGSSEWVSSNPPSYGVGLAKPYGPGGTFNLTLRISSAISSTIDCRTTACAVTTRNDHIRSGDRSQDVLVPVTFAGAQPLPSVPPTTAPSSPAPKPVAPATTARPSPQNPAVVAPNHSGPLGQSNPQAASPGVPAPGASEPEGPGSSTPVPGPSESTTTTDAVGGPLEVEAEAIDRGSSDAADKSSKAGKDSGDEESLSARASASNADGGSGGGGSGARGIWIAAVVFVSVLGSGGVFWVIRRRGATGVTP